MIPKNNITLYSYRLQCKYPLPVLGNKENERRGFLVLSETPHGYKIGEAAPLPSFHKVTFMDIQNELKFFIQKQHLPTRCHSLSQFAVDMLMLNEKNIMNYS